MQQCDKRLDASFEQVVDKLDIVINAFLVDRVVTATEGDNSSPRQGEAVGLCAQALQKSNIFSRPVIRVACDCSITPVGDFALYLTELIPNGRTTSVLIGGTLDLEADRRAQLG